MFRARRADRMPEAMPAVTGALRDDSGQRNENEDAQPADRDAKAYAGCRAKPQRCVARQDVPRRGARGFLRRHRTRRGKGCCHPTEFSILITMPLSGSKNFLLTADHPPRSLIVVS